MVAAGKCIFPGIFSLYSSLFLTLVTLPSQLVEEPKIVCSVLGKYHTQRGAGTGVGVVRLITALSQSAKGATSAAAAEAIDLKGFFEGVECASMPRPVGHNRAKGI